MIMKANKMKAIRYYLGLSQAQFAERLGVCQSTICIVEQGKRGVSDYIRGKLAHIEVGLPDDFQDFYITISKS